MSFKQVTTLAAAAAATIALSTAAYGDTGKSPNGPPGPAGNPNQPAAAQPQANGPAGPAGNAERGKSNSAPNNDAGSNGKSNASHGKSNAAPRGKSNASHGKSGESHGKSQAQHPATTHGNSGQGKSNNFGHGKITICHATKSVTNPYVEITISVNGLHGHGPADDPRHHAGSWKDIIPAPAGGCPSTAEQPSSSQPEQSKSHDNGKITICHATGSATNPFVEITISVNGLHGHGKHADDIIPAPAGGCPGATEQGVTQQGATPQANTPAPALTAPVSAFSPQSLVLGARSSGGKKPDSKKGAAPKSEVLGANASGNTAPASAVAGRRAATRGSLPFTGTQLALVLLIAAVALLGGFAIRRATLNS